MEIKFSRTMEQEEAITVNDKEKRYCLECVDRWDYPKGEYWEINDTFITNLKSENLTYKRNETKNTYF